MSQSSLLLSRLQSVLGSTALATVALAGPTFAQDVQDTETDASDVVVVTATKREMDAREIPGSVTALTGGQLSERGARGLGDAIAITPGAVLNTFEPGFTSVTLRGISSGSTGNSIGQEATGYYINDVPLTDPTISILVPDIDNFDVGDITVLRGPQGTLFGSGALGGVVNYRATEPDLTAFSAKVDASVEGLSQSDELGGSLKAMVNAPILQDRLGARLVLISRRDPGFIDNVGVGEQDTNSYDTYGGRLLLTAELNDQARLSYLGLTQWGESGDRSGTEPGAFGDFAHSSAFLEAIDNRVIINSLRLDHDFDLGTFTGIVNRHQKMRTLHTDSTPGFQGIFGPGTPTVTNDQDQDSSGYGLELRFASRSGEAFDYVVGVMHDDTTVTSNGVLSAPNADDSVEAFFESLGEGPGFGALLTREGRVLNTFDLVFEGRETAVFGEGGIQLTDSLSLTLGGRAFWVESESRSTNTGFLNFFAASEVSTSQNGTASEEGFSPKISLSYAPSEDFLVYGLISRGFRFGGPNLFSDEAGFDVPNSFGSDSLVNHEIGVRTDWLDSRLRIDLNLFYIDWTDIQITRFTPSGNQYTDNGSAAVSQGVDLSVRAKLTPSATWSSAVTYLDASLTEAIDDIPAGSVLPGASEWKISNDLAVSLYVLPLAPTLLLSHRYISEAPSILGAPGFTQGDYHVFDARLTLDLGEVDVSLFARNIGDERGVAFALPSFFSPAAQYVERPRTIGITLSRNW